MPARAACRCRRSSKGAGLITGNYVIPAASLRAVSVFTNTIPTQAYRSSGRPEVTFAIERLIDMAAAKLGIDRISLRRRNLVRPKSMPYRNAVGMTYDSGTYEDNMDLAMRIADWDGFTARKREAKKRGKLLGLGLANYVESSIGAPKEQARITVKPDAASTSSSAPSRPDKAMRPVSRRWCRTCCRCRSRACASSWATPTWCAPAAARIRAAPCAMPRPCSRMAATTLIANGKRIAAHLLDAGEADFNDGRFTARGTNRSFDFLELAQEMEKHPLPDDLAKGLAIVTDNEMHDPVFPNGCAVCEIEIDPSTGGLALTRYASVDDVGRCINPLIVHGQTHGAVVQGVGQALWEQFVVDDFGQPLTGSLMDYGMPRAHLAAVDQERNRRGAVADQSARHQGRRRRRHHRRAGGDRHRHRRCAQALRHSTRRYAGDALSRLAGDREHQGEKRQLNLPIRYIFHSDKAIFLQFINHLVFRIVKLWVANFQPITPEECRREFEDQEGTSGHFFAFLPTNSRRRRRLDPLHGRH